MSIQQDLIINAKEYFQNAMLCQKKKQYNSSVTLFFKTIATLTDLFILKKEGKIPTNHSERFRILQKNYPEIYKILDKNFPFYQDSYRLKLKLDVSKIFENDCRKMFKLIGREM